MILKKCVTLINMKPQMLIALMVSNQIFSDQGFTMFVKAVCNNEHASDSLHYNGLAVDISTLAIHKNMVEKMANAIRDALTGEFNVFVEVDNIHIEYRLHDLNCLYTKESKGFEKCDSCTQPGFCNHIGKTPL
jgi:hypothetical protein